MNRNERKQVITKEFEASIAVKQAVIQENIEIINLIAEKVTEALRGGNKLMLFGNGGSAADSQHIAAEFVNRFNFDRRPLAAIAFTTDTSILTSTSNDYSFEDVFWRQVIALGKKGDVALGISTSGNSPNVIKALQEAKTMGITTVGFTGQKGGKLKEIADICLCVPSNATPRIQEVHITAAHCICNIAEKELCG
jgi:D-sedoheptulose 7-phosphate isomerase